jgi:hypothetical protein
MASDCTLLFPPVSEARLFPYLSLPMLAAWLRRAGLRVRQRDLNLEMAHVLFTPAQLRAVAACRRRAPATLATRYRAEMAAFLADHCDELVAASFDKRADGRFPPMNAVRFVRQGLDLLLEESVLVEHIPSLPGLAARAAAAVASAADDPPLAALRALLADELAAHPPGILAISIPFYSQLLPALIIARLARQLSPTTRIVLGGQQIMLFGDRLAVLPGMYEFVDALGIGPGEETLATLHAVGTTGAPRDRVPELIWLHADGPRPTAVASTVTLDQMPPPDVSDLPYRRYLIEEVQLGMITCVGCYWGRCAFCSYGQRSRARGYQQMSPEAIADVCAHLIAATGVHRIGFVDENTNLRVAARAARLVADRGLPLRFSTRNRLEPLLLDRAFCHELRALGCELMSVGYETSSQRLLDVVDKGVQARDYQPIIDNLHEAGIDLRLSVLGGLPGETEDEEEASADFLRRNADRIGIDIVQMLVAEPGTPLADDLAGFGLIASGPDELRGNRLLNVGAGRVGPAFHYSDGASFAAREERCARRFHSFHPQKNDELAPLARPAAAPTDDVGRARAITLHPWVRVLDGADGRPAALLADLLWQEFYRLPDIARVDDSRRVVAVDGSGRGIRLLRELLRAGAGTARPEAR